MTTTPQSSTTEQASPELTRLYMAIGDAPSYRQEIRAARMAAFVRACLPPTSGEQPKGWREECSVNRAFDATYYVKEPWTGKLLQVGTGTWEGTNADAYFSTAFAARAALAQAPDPREPCRFSPGVCNDANCNDCGPLVAQHASTPSPVAPPVQTQGGDTAESMLAHPHGMRYVDDEGRCLACVVEVLRAEIARLRTPSVPGSERVSVALRLASELIEAGPRREDDGDTCEHCQSADMHTADCLWIRAREAVRAAISSPASQPAPEASGYDTEKVEALLEACDNIWAENWPEFNSGAQMLRRHDIYQAAKAVRASRPATPPPAGRPTPEEFKAMFDRDMARTFTPPADTPPATVPVPLELAREWQLTRKQLRSGLRGDCLASRLYDTLAAGVKEAERGK